MLCFVEQELYVALYRDTDAASDPVVYLQPFLMASVRLPDPAETA